MGGAPAEDAPLSSDMERLGVAHQQSLLVPTAAPGHRWMSRPDVQIGRFTYHATPYSIAVIERNGSDTTLALEDKQVSCRN